MFPVIWAVLYVLIAPAATRISEVPDNDLALGLWEQITINNMWLGVFFGPGRDGDHRGVVGGGAGHDVGVLGALHDRCPVNVRIPDLGHLRTCLEHLGVAAQPGSG